MTKFGQIFYINNLILHRNNWIPSHHSSKFHPCAKWVNLNPIFGPISGLLGATPTLFVQLNFISNGSLSNTKIFEKKNCKHKLKIIELASAIAWNMSAIKIVDINKMVDHVVISTLILKLFSRSFRIQKCNLWPTSFPVTYFELWEK